MSRDKVNSSILDQDTPKFFFPDTRTRYFQVKDETGYQVLVQHNHESDITQDLPYRYDGSDEAKRTCCSSGKEWCLDRCCGVMEVTDRDSIFVTSNTEVVEVRPCFRRVKTVNIGYPKGEIEFGKTRRHVDILLPIAHPTEELKKLVGCNNIKQRLLEFKALADYNSACLQQDSNLPIMQIFLHSVFYGNPGTGKTTVCRLYGALLKEAGLLSKGHVVVVDRGTLACEYFGETEMIINQLLDMSQGGILMFDEAYLLEGSHRDDPNKMVLPLLLSALADEKNKDFAVVLCGYKDKLDKMIDQNPGLYSRFVNRFEFKDYTLDELTEIGIRYLKEYGHTFSSAGLKGFREKLSDAMTGSDTATWANARTVKNMVEHTYIQHAMHYDKDGIINREITAEDVTTIPYEQRRRIGF